MYVIAYAKNIIFIYIIFYLRLISSYILKEELLKIKNNYYASYYCKDEFCVRVNDEYNNYFIEIPDKNNNITNYIVHTCTFNDIESNYCDSTRMINGENYSVECNNDSECLSNKCYKNHCMFNEEIPIVHCDNIYSDKLFLGKSSYMYCGKPPNDSCIENDECSSKNCRDNMYQFQLDGPSDSDSIQTAFEGLIIGGVSIIIIITAIIICCYCYKKHT